MVDVMSDEARMIPAAFPWPTNGHLLADVAALHIEPDDLVLDMTYGRGVWWRIYRPPHLIAHDLHTLDGVDFTALPEADSSVDVVAFDPPYKLNGTPTVAVDARYGVDRPATPHERHALIRAGLDEAARVLRPGGRLLLKCQDQVSAGKRRWQCREFANYAEAIGLEQLDQFEMLGTARPQPMSGRRQRHAHGPPSVLLVFEKTKTTSPTPTRRTT